MNCGRAPIIVTIFMILALFLRQDFLDLLLFHHFPKERIEIPLYYIINKK